MTAEVIGREEELDAIEQFLARVADGPAALVLSGEGGIQDDPLEDGRRRGQVSVSGVC